MSKTALVVGAGPAGLMAAETMALGGLSVMVADAMPSFGRKFLMAGKSGLNLTKLEDPAAFCAAYSAAATHMTPMLAEFGPSQVQEWTEGLDQEVFVGSTGRLFPKAMKASPLLRAWLARLDSLGVRFERRWRWTGWGADGGATFETPDGTSEFAADVTVLAMGGASWRRLGSDGAWASVLAPNVADFQPANVGVRRAWSDHMAPVFGEAVKGCALSAGRLASRGEFIITRDGLEGGGIYEVSAALRDGAPLYVDLFPDQTVEKLVERLAKPKGKSSLANHLRKTLRLTGARAALVNEILRPMPEDMATALKSIRIDHDGPRPMDEAISTAGGVRFSALTDGLMLKDRAGVFCAGEMLDWEAKTGGYLITGCLATGRWAGLAAVEYATA